MITTIARLISRAATMYSISYLILTQIDKVIIIAQLVYINSRTYFLFLKDINTINCTPINRYIQSSVIVEIIILIPP